MVIATTFFPSSWVLTLESIIPHMARTAISEDFATDFIDAENVNDRMHNDHIAGPYEVAEGLFALGHRGQKEFRDPQGRASRPRLRARHQSLQAS